jgi:hypothetical protein
MFREIMCSVDNTPDEKFEAWGALLRIYFCCDSTVKAVPDEESNCRDTAMSMLSAEFPLRMGLELSLRMESLFIDKTKEKVIEIGENRMKEIGNA